MNRVGLLGFCYLLACVLHVIYVDANKDQRSESCSSECDCYKNALETDDTRRQCFTCFSDNTNHLQTCRAYAACASGYICARNITTHEAQCYQPSELATCFSDNDCVDQRLDFTNYGYCMQNGKCRYPEYGQFVTSPPPGTPGAQRDNHILNPRVLDHHQCQLNPVRCETVADCYNSNNNNQGGRRIYHTALTCHPTSHTCKKETTVPSQTSPVSCSGSNTQQDDYCTMMRQGHCSRCVRVDWKNATDNNGVFQCTEALTATPCASGKCNQGVCHIKRCSSLEDCIDLDRHECFTCNPMDNLCHIQSRCRSSGTTTQTNGNQYCTRTTPTVACSSTIRSCTKSEDCDLPISNNSSTTTLLSEGRCIILVNQTGFGYCRY